MSKDICIKIDVENTTVLPIKCDRALVITKVDGTNYFDLRKVNFEDDSSVPIQVDALINCIKDLPINTAIKVFTKLSTTFLDMAVELETGVKRKPDDSNQ